MTFAPEGAAFQCPACGGPVQLSGNKPVIRCPYCQGSVGETALFDFLEVALRAP
jgi:hypothetical protein